MGDLSHVSHLDLVCTQCVGICGGGLGVAAAVRRLFRPEWRWVAPGPARDLCALHSGSHQQGSSSHLASTQVPPPGQRLVQVWASPWRCETCKDPPWS